MRYGETYTDTDAAVSLLNVALEQYKTVQLDPKSRRKFIFDHGKNISMLIAQLYVASVDLIFINGSTDLQKYAIDLKADGLPKPQKELGEVLEPGETTPITHGALAAPVSEGLYREHFFGSPLMTNDPTQPVLMFSFAEMIEASPAGGGFSLE